MLAMKFMGKLSSFGLFVMRVGLGLIFIVHGSGKLFGGSTTWANVGGAMTSIGVNKYPILWGFMAAVTEFGGGIFLILGFLFRPSAIALTFVMVMAVLMHLHNNDPFKSYSHAMSLAVVFFGLVFIGPGKISIDGE